LEINSFWNPLKRFYKRLIRDYYYLFHFQGGSTRDTETPPPKLPEHTMSVACASLNFLHRIVRQRLTMVQVRNCRMFLLKKKFELGYIDNKVNEKRKSVKPRFRNNNGDIF
jgi:hypothetical protein